MITQSCPGNDWFFIGKTSTKYYQYPPHQIEDEVITGFSDTLNEIIPEKLKELIERQDFLVKTRHDKLEKLESLKLTEWGIFIWINLLELEFSEYDVLQKWLKYWLRLAEKSGNNVYNQEKIAQGGITEEDVAQAKEVPLESIYEENLKRVGSRFVARCPFHKENTPSFTIFTNTNNFYCFGCHTWGDSIDLYMQINQCDFPTAVRGLLHG